MYFDTLKVTSIEQSASDVSARGGLHNADLITWKFGKEINIKVTDALYTPNPLPFDITQYPSFKALRFS